MSDTPQRDPMREFTDCIIAELEKGVKPWERPWDPEKAGGPQAPFNPVTGKRSALFTAVTLLNTDSNLTNTAVAQTASSESRFKRAVGK
jgi:antirestriction protein ArdC